jgi:hypothetical protein
MNEILIQGHHEGVAIHTQQLKAIAGLSKIMDRIGGTNQDGILSNVELTKANNPQSCPVFTSEQGRKCSRAPAEIPIRRNISYHRKKQVLKVPRCALILLPIRYYLLCQLCSFNRLRLAVAGRISLCHR